MVARLLAIVVAVGMITGAYAYRYGLPGGSGDGAGGSDASRGEVHCASELESACDALGEGVVVEPAATTARKLITARSRAAAGITGWLAPGAWPAMVDEARKLSSKPPMFATRGETLATTSLAAVARKGQLPPGCAPVAFRCLGDAAQDPAFRISADAPTHSVGLFVRAALLNGYFGKSDYATNDLDEQPDARAWLDNVNLRLASAASFGARTLDSFVLQQGSARVYLTTAAASRRLRGNAQFEVSTPAATVVIAARYATTATSGARIDAGRVRTELVGAGWDSAGPDVIGSGLPSPGVLLALSDVG